MIIFSINFLANKMSQSKVSQSQSQHLQTAPKTVQNPKIFNLLSHRTEKTSWESPWWGTWDVTKANQSRVSKCSSWTATSATRTLSKRGLQQMNLIMEKKLKHEAKNNLHLDQSYLPDLTLTESRNVKKKKKSTWQKLRQNDRSLNIQTTHTTKSFPHP